MYLRIVVASALGAVAGIELGKHVSDSPLALIAWGIIGAFIGFIAINPREWVDASVLMWRNMPHTIKQRWQHYQQESRARSQKHAQERAKIRAEDKARKEAYRLIRQLLLIENLKPLLFGFWVLIVPSSFTFIYVLLETHQTYRLDPVGLFGLKVSVVALITFIILMFLMILSPGRARNYYIKTFFTAPTGYHAESILNEDADDPAFAAKEIRSDLEKSLKHLPKYIFGPLWFIYWFIVTKCFLIKELCLLSLFTIKCVLLMFSKATAMVVSVDRYAAAIGAIVGYVVVLQQAHNHEIVGAIVGAASGVVIHLMCSFLQAILPDPKSPWPSLKLT